ncbi:MADS-box transcription factor 27 [Glycine soja]
MVNNTKRQREQSWFTPLFVTKVEEIPNQTNFPTMINEMPYYSVQKIELYTMQMMGEELSGLGIKELGNLENRQEMSLKDVHMKKDQIVIDELKELHQKGSLFHQQNVELNRKINFIRKENEKLQKVYKRHSVYFRICIVKNPRHRQAKQRERQLEAKNVIC